MALTDKGRTITMKYSYSLLHNQGTLSSAKSFPYSSCGKAIPLTPGSSRLPVSPKGGIGVEVRVDIIDLIRKKKETVEKHCETHSPSMHTNQKIFEV